MNTRGHLQSRSAFVLVAVLVVIMLASMVVVSLMFRLKAEDTAAAAGAASEQAWAAAMSGIEEAMSVARQSAAGALDWQDNPALFRERLVCDDGAERWYFTVYSAGNQDEREELRYGLTDEAGRLNVNTALETNLMRLPNMTVSLVQTLLDFMDADDTPHPEGAEQEYYDALPHPYTIRNGPLATLDDLLLVRGFTATFLYGEDMNMNFILDPNEDDGDQVFPPDNNDGRLDPGLRALLTVSSYDLNEDNDGVPRTDLNDPADPLPGVELPPAFTNYLALMRSNNVSLAHVADVLEAEGKFKDPSGKDVQVQSGIGKEELAQILDLFTTTTDYELTGLININTASPQVLQTLPEIDEAMAESIVSARRNMSPELRATPAWLYSEGVVSADTFKKLAPYLTARSRQFRFHVVGYGVPSGRFRTLEVAIDLAQGKPVITYLRDMTRLGLPFRIEMTTEAAGG